MALDEKQKTIGIESLDSNKKKKIEFSTQDDETITCTICQDSWTSTGDHCLVSLSCGHLYGKGCIIRWIEESIRKKAKNAKCPMCLKQARTADIRMVLPIKLVARDSSQRDSLIGELESKKLKVEERRRELAESRLALNMLKRQIERTKENIMDYGRPSSNKVETLDIMNEQIEKDETNDLGYMKDTVMEPYEFKGFSVFVSKQLSSSKQASRVFSLNRRQNNAYISFKSDSRYGVLKFDLLNMADIGFMQVHDALVRDVQYSEAMPNMILTTSFDKTLKTVSTDTNSVAHIFDLPFPGYSCCFDNNDPNKLFCGLVDSSVAIYDIRYPKTQLYLLKDSTIPKTPLHSMSVKSKDNNQFTVYCSNTTQSFTWDVHEDTPVCKTLNTCNDGYKPYSMTPVNNSNSLLISSRKDNNTKHQILNLQDQTENIVLSHLSPHPQLSLVRTFAYTAPPYYDNEAVLCIPEEESKSLYIKPTSSNPQRIRFESCPLDVKLCSEGKMVVLTENKLSLLTSNL